jgi:transcriptional regulator with XRE-family HTH domain
MEQQTINQRINFLVEHFEKGRKAAFARTAGISPQGLQELLTGRQGDPSFKVLTKILEGYPQVQTDWLVLGRGQMLKDSIGADGPSTRGLLLALNADLDATSKRLTYWQEKLKSCFAKQDLIDMELTFLHEAPEPDGAESELYSRGMMFAEEMSRQNRSDIDGVEEEIRKAHARLATLHQRTADLLEDRQSAAEAGPPPVPKRATVSPMKSSGVVT